MNLTKFGYRFVFRFITWRFLLLLGLIAVSLQGINFCLSWCSQFVSSPKYISNFTFSRHHLTEKISSTHSDVIDHILKWSVLDSSGMYKYSIGILQNGSRFNLANEHVGNRKHQELSFDVTLATQCSLANLRLLPQLSKRWQGPISVTVFLLVEELEAGVAVLLLLRKCYPEIRANTTFSVVFPSSNRTLSTIVSLRSDATSCSQIFSTVKNFNRSNYEFPDIPYPNNLLRNVARKAVKGMFTVVLDVDMLPSQGLYSKFLDFYKENYMMRMAVLEEKIVWVLPAYEIKKDLNAPENKSDLLRMIRANDAHPFYKELCWKCQAYTNYDRWEKEYPVSNEKYLGLNSLYEVMWKDPWEPFYISKNNVPFYDEQFRQYGFNRISQMCELHVAGYHFLVLDSAFVVHQGFKMGQLHHSKNTELESNKILFRQFKTNLKKKYPESSRRCY